MSDDDNESPLISKVELDRGLYGSVHHRPHDEGGLVNEMPTEGYVMVFVAESKAYTLQIESGELKVIRNPDMSEGDYFEDGWDDKIKSATDNRQDNLLKYFKSANIQYKILRSRDRKQKYIYVIITTKKRIAERWADEHNIDVPIEPAEAVRVGQQFEEFALARRTRLSDDEPATFTVTNEEDGESKEYEKLELSYWENIHIAYETTIDRKVYKKDDEHHPNSDSIITHRLYLRILYEMLTDDRPLGGANFIVEKYLQNKTHPLQHFFALHQSRTERPEVTKEKCFKCRTPKQNLEFCDNIREYYGENVGFYFHFLVHYTKWLYPMAILGTIWFIIQMSTTKTWGIATPGSTIIVLIAIMWSTMMIENWYRREWKLRFKWGMMRYKQTEIPRPSFSGQIKVSRENGELIETHTNWYTYCCKITFSMSTMFLCVAIVVAVVFALFLLKGQNRAQSELTIAIGITNSIQIFIMNKIYTFLAYKLNEWEGHRLQQDYYNNLVVKRIIFIVFNSFYSLFYIAFFDDNPIYDDDDEKRLDAVRTQLITLFAMALFLQNSLEVLFPWIYKVFVFPFCAKYSTFFANPMDLCRKQRDEVGYRSDSLLDADPTAGRPQVDVVHAGDDDITLPIESGDDVMDDIEEQIRLIPSPDVLDNTAEIVVLHGYIMLFVIIFPLMPLLAVINNYFELRVDFYNLINTQRPIPASASGIGVWKTVLSCFNIIAIFSNLAIITFRTPLVRDILNDIGYDHDTDVIVFYFCMVLVLLFTIFIIRVAIDDVDEPTKEAICRQEACERYLLKAPVANIARKAAHQHRMKQSKRKVFVNNDDDEEQKDDQ